jgi:hypothetical protein
MPKGLLNYFSFFLDTVGNMDINVLVPKCTRSFFLKNSIVQRVNRHKKAMAPHA